MLFCHIERGSYSITPVFTQDLFIDKFKPKVSIGDLKSRRKRVSVRVYAGKRYQSGISQGQGFF